MKLKGCISVMIALVMSCSCISLSNFSNEFTIVANASSDVSNLYPVDSTYAFIKSVEGYSSQCFWDVAQWTIGYGNKCPHSHSSNGSYYGQKGGHTISEEDARTLFSSKLSSYVSTLKSNCSGLPMTQNQFDALLSATYNHGNVNSCPLKYYLQGKLTESEAREQYYVWCINKGTSTEQGLRNRRKKEADLFFSDANEHPIGYLDSYGTDGRNVNVYGWTFDPSSPSSQLAVHIYLRDSEGGMHCIGALTADTSRPDVDNVYGCGEYHGYEGSGSAAGLPAGDYTVQVAYLDVEDGGNGATWVSGGTVTINPDSEGPSISDIKIVDISTDGYTVQCTAEDSSGVSSVKFPTWTDYNGQDDIIWGEGTASGNVWSYRVNKSEHNNELGAYITHIYAYDNAGNHNAVGTSTYLEDKAPKINDVIVEDVSATGYTVKCTVVDEGGSGLDRVQFPTWTLENDQDDIQPSWQTNQTASGTIDGDTVTFRVNISDHNNEVGTYRTHIYAYDKSGNASCVAVDDVTLENVPPKISNVKIIDIDDNGYTVQCTVTDDGIGVDHVAFPTWTITRNGQDDLESGWENSDKYAGVVKNDGKTYTYRVNKSDHNNENGCYRTHIYAWDKSGNMASFTSDKQINYVMFDEDDPAIYNIKITNIDKTGYTISCNIRDDIDIDRVQFPTWTELNGQDDIQADWTVNEKASGTPYGNTYAYRVKTSSHNNELGTYITHIYAYDKDGNYYHASTDMGLMGLHQISLTESNDIPNGDINSDGEFNVADVVLLQKWLLAVPNTHIENWKAANFCKDECLDVFDLCLMKRKLIYG